MGYIQIIIAALSLGRELVKYLRQKEQVSAVRVDKLRNFKSAVKKARKQNDTSDIERSFSELGFFVRDDK